MRPWESAPAEGGGGRESQDRRSIERSQGWSGMYGCYLCEGSCRWGAWEGALNRGGLPEGEELRKGYEAGNRNATPLRCQATIRGGSGVRVATESVFSPRKHWKLTTQ